MPGETRLPTKTECNTYWDLPRELAIRMVDIREVTDVKDYKINNQYFLLYILYKIIIIGWLFFMFLIDRVPENWEKISWISTTLGFWYTELLERDSQFKRWCYHGRPKVPYINYNIEVYCWIQVGGVTGVHLLPLSFFHSMVKFWDVIKNLDFHIYLYLKTLMFFISKCYYIIFTGTDFYDF